MVTENKPTSIQLELLRILQFIKTEEQLSEVKQLLNLYFRKQLDIAIEKAEEEKGLTEEVYAEWFKNANK